MNAEVFAEWLRRSGRQVFRTQSSYWHHQGFRVFQAFPYHWTVDPSKDELRSLLGANKAVALRYCAPFESRQGAMSYQVVYDKPRYALEDLSPNARRNVRKGLAYAEIEQIPLARLAGEGWALRYETLERQGRVKAESQGWWERLCMSAEGLPGFEAWAALHEGQMVSSLLTFTCEDCVDIVLAQSATDHLQHRVAHALLFTVTQEIVSRPEISQILHGMHSLDAPASVDEFKFRLNFEPRPVRERAVFHPLLSPLLRRPTLAGVQRLAAFGIGRARLGKIEGMVRLRVQERLPADRQEIPDPVARLLQSRPATPGSGHQTSPINEPPGL